MQKIIKESYERCKSILLENKDRLELIAQTLLEVETLDAEQIKSLMNEGKLPEEHHSNNSVKETNEKEVGTEDVKVNIQTKKDGISSDINGDIEEKQ